MQSLASKSLFTEGNRVEVDPDRKGLRWSKGIVRNNFGDGFYSIECEGGRKIDRISGRFVRKIANTKHENKFKPSEIHAVVTHASHKPVDHNMVVSHYEATSSPIQAKKPKASRNPKTKEELVLLERVRNCRRSGERELDIHTLSLSTLTEHFQPLANVRNLNARKNFFVSIDSFLHFMYLEKLDVSFNLLGNGESADQSFVGLEKLQLLKSLNISSNKLSSLPSSLRELHLLEELVVRSNCLVDVPAWLGEALPLLATLDLAHNQIASLPESLEQLTALRILYVDGNKCAGEIASDSHLAFVLDQVRTRPDTVGTLHASSLMSCS
jgi:Leucine-rich repeat (LRR) protein